MRLDFLEKLVFLVMLEVLVFLVILVVLELLVILVILVLLDLLVFLVILELLEPLEPLVLLAFINQKSSASAPPFWSVTIRKCVGTWHSMPTVVFAVVRQRWKW